tara:strand:- start:3126 stop:3494 length:369 start_codon:yes stop_codon:yes gene_type:complete
MGQIYGKTAVVPVAGSRAGTAVAIASATLGFNCRERAVHPGIIDSPLWQKSIRHLMGTETEELASSSDTKKLNVDEIDAQLSTLDRAGRPDEVFKLIVSLTPHAPSYLIGQAHCTDEAMPAS